jgi:glyoxylase-like metal-dependent hydrolase (beta-lactamase superfamily II)
MAFARPTLDPAETLVRQVERLGFKPSDVKHILPTHLDVDHAGGLPDFPEATVHILAAEKKAATERSTLPEKLRYRPAQLAHGPRWKVYEPGGDTWMGLASVRALSDDIVLVPTRGHTRGHACVAVRSGEKWLLHCGDAYFFHGEMAPEPTCPPALRFFQARVAIDDAARLANQARLRALHAERSAEVEVFSAHCIVEFARYAGR